jgi:hypothetical protein
MTEQLTRFWTGQAQWDEVIEFCERMTALRSSIRQRRGIKAPMITCPDCGTTGRSELPGISVRSTLFALRKIEALSETQMKELDRDWSRYRKAHALDAYGHKAEAQPATPPYSATPQTGSPLG